MTKSRSIWIFRKIASIEGWSYLLLLFVAMPLKYWAGMTDVVPLVGMIHGWLFVAYMIALFAASSFGGLSMTRVSWAVLVSFLPFGTFLHDPYLKREELAVRDAQTV